MKPTGISFAGYWLTKVCVSISSILVALTRWSLPIMKKLGLRLLRVPLYSVPDQPVWHIFLAGMPVLRQQLTPSLSMALISKRPSRRLRQPVANRYLAVRLVLASCLGTSVKIVPSRMVPTLPLCTCKALPRNQNATGLYPITALLVLA